MALFDEREIERYKRADEVVLSVIEETLSDGSKAYGLIIVRDNIQVRCECTNATQAYQLAMLLRNVTDIDMEHC